MDTPPLDTMARGLLMLSPRLRLMLVFTMVDMDMVLDILVLAMPDLDMLDLDMLDLDMLPLPTDTPPLDTMARDLLMLSPRLRLMLVFTMVDMDMVLDMPDSAMLDTDMDILPTDTLPLDTMARGLLMLSQRLRLMLVFTMVDMDMVLAILVLAMLDMDIPLMVLDTVDTTMVRSISKYVDEAKAQSNHRLAHCYSVPSFEV